MSPFATRTPIGTSGASQGRTVCRTGRQVSLVWLGLCRADPDLPVSDDVSAFQKKVSEDHVVVLANPCDGACDVTFRAGVSGLTTLVGGTTSAFKAHVYRVDERQGLGANSWQTSAAGRDAGPMGEPVNAAGRSPPENDPGRGSALRANRKIRGSLCISRRLTGDDVPGRTTRPLRPSRSQDCSSGHDSSPSHGSSRPAGPP